MNKKIFLSILLCGSFAYAENLQSAKILKSISKKATERVISDFKGNPITKDAYDETKNYIADRLATTANEGFYNIVYVNINDIYKEVKVMKYNQLSSKEKDMLESILKTELGSLGYKVESGQYDNIGLHWAISWE